MVTIEPKRKLGICLILKYIFLKILWGSEMYYIGEFGFTVAFNDVLTDYVKEKVRNYNFYYRDLSTEEYSKWIIKITSTLQDLRNHPEVHAGTHRAQQWERGWLESYKAGHIVPKYFGKYPVVRWMQKLVYPCNTLFEYNMFAMIQHWLFDKYMRDASAIYEFGCGTGHNLLRVEEVAPSASLWGLDWTAASCKLVRRLGLKAARFNMFTPDNFRLEPHSVVYTVASMEQLGISYKPFVTYLLEQRPSLIIHIEPIGELLDPTNLLDYLSLQYFTERNYLYGYLSYLRELEEENKIEIIQAERTYVGSLFVDGYSVVVWKPA